MNAIHKAPTLSSNLATLTTDIVKGDRYIRNRWEFLAEGYHSEGISAFMLAKPEKGEKSPFEKLHKSIENAIFESFDDDVKALMKKEPKTLSKIDQGTRRYWKQQIGSYFNKIRTQLVKKEEELANGDDAKTRKTPGKKARMQQKHNELVKIAKGFDSADFDVKAYLSKMKEAENILNNVKLNNVK